MAIAEIILEGLSPSGNGTIYFPTEGFLPAVVTTPTTPRSIVPPYINKAHNAVTNGPYVGTQRDSFPAMTWARKSAQANLGPYSRAQSRLPSTKGRWATSGKRPATKGPYGS